MKKLALIPVLAIVLMAIIVPSCKKETITKTDTVLVQVKTMTLYATKDAAIFNGTTTYNANGTDGLYNDYGSGGSDLLRVGYSDDNYFLMRSLLAFDVSSIPAKATILDASLVLTIARIGNTAKGVEVHKVTEAWTEGTTREDPNDDCLWSDSYCSTPGTAIIGTDVSWSHANFNSTAWGTTGGTATATASASVSVGGNTTFTSDGLVADVQSWLATPASNFGWMLKANESSILGEGGEQIRYFSREAAANGAPADTRPKLIIQYSE